ncbi:PAS domain S-box protein [Virgibacillus sp. DJP39]|uniref:PAS domain S-box protein n=1 Tax=Virgibacillus sp. DJP39 TaxID=3409790 RepID=UPI003BB6329B
MGVTVNVNQLSEKSDDTKYLNRLFSAYMDTTDNGVALIDFNGKFLLTNESFIRLFGYTKAELSETNLSEFQPHLNKKLNIYITLLEQGEKIQDLTLELSNKNKQVLYTTI